MEGSVNRERLSTFNLCDMQVYYYLETEKKHVDFCVIPTVCEEKMKDYKFSRGESMIHLKLLGDNYPSGYAGGLTMHDSGTLEYFQYDHQEVIEEKECLRIHTYLKDKRGFTAIHRLCWYRGEVSFELDTVFCNESQETVMLEYITSFCLNEITPLIQGEATGSLMLHRLRSKWSNEGRLVSESIEDLQLEPSYCYYPPHAERFGQVGSMPVKKYFPFVAVEDTDNQVIWGVQLAHEASWQMQLYRRDEALVIDGGLADREFGHWMKNIEPMECFETPKAILSVCVGDINRVCQRLTKAGEKYVNAGPMIEQELPILFNEYCTTWGLPSHENIAGIVDAIKERPIDYFVIDCGWFVEEGKPWYDSMGDYVPSPRLFPEGLISTTEYIKNAGMKPGIWFEIDNVGKEARAYHEEENLLKRDGFVLTTGTRRFYDMRKPSVRELLTKKVIGQLKQYGFEYIKMDYNDTIGLGCDGAESLGEGLRQNMEASLDFVRTMKEEVSGIIIENCASGGHKLEPLMMSLCSMASFSDAHECEEIPIVAANLHRAILPRQSQIWAVIRENDTTKRIAYTMAATFLGRMCLSGDVTKLTDDQWRIIDQGIAFYKNIVPMIKDGYTYYYGEQGTSTRHPDGWQGIVRMKEDGSAYVVIHAFAKIQPYQKIEILLPENCIETVQEVFSHRLVEWKIENHKLIVTLDEEWETVALRMV